jgi:hypothetical protein
MALFSGGFVVGAESSRGPSNVAGNEGTVVGLPPTSRGNSVDSPSGAGLIAGVTGVCGILGRLAGGEVVGIRVGLKPPPLAGVEGRLEAAGGDRFADEGVVSSANRPMQIAKANVRLGILASLLNSGGGHARSNRQVPNVSRIAVFVNVNLDLSSGYASAKIMVRSNC